MTVAEDGAVVKQATKNDQRVTPFGGLSLLAGWFAAALLNVGVALYLAIRLKLS